ncbi:DNA primase [Blastomonas sp.]|uniref:DNA primase n=1 Tax=Blastomonas sp. TaxID=1909299 RepID=UPI003593B31F
MTLTPQWLDELRSRITLSSLIGRHVKVQRAGREYKACCPFHNEKTPSFTINDDKGFYHCFGCGAHGDAIRFMTDHQGLGFMDAVKELAAEAGMTVPAPDPRAAQAAEARASLHDVCQAAQDWFVAQLHSAAGEQARAYLKHRGLSAETIKRFGIGFAPDSRTGIKSALASIDEALLVEAGLLIKVDDRTPYDRFRGRIMIPIRDPRGRVIAFGGRILGSGEPKYLNSPDTPLFDKGRTLYNLDLAAPASRQTGRVIVVEGYMDVIALAQAGFGECVAPLGTALTEHQLDRLWKMVDQPLLCFDGDGAGQKAALRAVSRALPLLRPGQSIGFVPMPAGQDPDDLIRAQGAAAFAALAANPISLLDHLWACEYQAEPLSSPEARAGLKARLIAHADNIGDSDIKALYKREINQRFSDTFFAPRLRTGQGASFEKARFDKGQFERGRPWQRRDILPPPDAETLVLSRQPISDLVLRGVLLGLIQRPEQIAAHSEQLADYLPLAGPWAGLLDALIEAALGASRLDTAGILTILAERGADGSAKQLMQGTNPGFSFCQPIGESPELAREAIVAEDLHEAIELMTIRPKLLAALRDVTRRFENECEDGLFLEQQQLRAKQQHFDQRLIALAERGT